MGEAKSPMPYSSNRDRNVSQLEITKAPWPQPPLNLFIRGGFELGVIDIRWDDPAVLVGNGDFCLVGVNIYRSFDSEFGPYQRITELPIGSNFWRDRTDNELITEDVTPQFIINGEESTTRGSRYVFQTSYFPIIKEGSQATTANRPEDVRVYIDGKEARVLSVHGFTGEVEIDPSLYANVEQQKYDPSLVPGPTSRVTCVYRRNRSLLRTDLAQRVFYRVTTVALPAGCDVSSACPTDFLETPIEHATATNNYETEKLDYIWKEAIRRNRWILEQGGERVQVFLRKSVGIPCTCYADDYHKQPVNDHKLCYGTGIIGGYEGPYEAIIAPDDEVRRVSQKDIGRTVEHAYEVWTGPVPILSQRDFLVKINGDRYSIGGVRFPTNRGMVLQQHFNIGHLDEKDIRYSVPLSHPQKFTATSFLPGGPEEEASTQITDKQDIPEERQLRGRTKVWENIEY